jgi:hypothetical protein
MDKVHNHPTPLPEGGQRWDPHTHPWPGMHGHDDEGNVIDVVKCNWCGGPSDKYSSGSAICWSCWYWTHMDLPAARHWAKVAEAFLSNVDMYDLIKFLPACGLTKKQIETMLKCAQKVQEHSELVKSGPPNKRDKKEKVKA